jgi:AhpD family alkylhydroperoxidase
MNERAEQVLAKIREDRGFVQRSREIWAKYNPESLDLYHRMFMHVMEEKNTIDRKTKELIIIAIDAANLYETGLKVHFRSALKQGISVEEIFEVLEIASVVNGVHALAVSLPILESVLQEDND